MYMLVSYVNHKGILFSFCEILGRCVMVVHMGKHDGPLDRDARIPKGADSKRF